MTNDARCHSGEKSNSEIYELQLALFIKAFFIRPGPRELRVTGPVCKLDSGTCDPSSLLGSGMFKYVIGCIKTKESKKTKHKNSKCVVVR